MKFLTYQYNNKIEFGLIISDKVIRLKDILINAPGRYYIHDTMLDFIRHSDDKLIEYIESQLTKTSFKSIPLEKVKIMAPIPWPQRDIICLGKNYRKHAEEVAHTIVNREAVPSVPIYFSKSAFPAIGDGDNILAHEDITSQIDYEAELAIVIGHSGKNIKMEEAEKYIFGYTIINDISARDIQNSHQQWYRGKSLDTFCPMGPYIVHKSEIPFPVELDIYCTVNGEKRQNSNTSNMIFNIPFIISQLSDGMELKAGDIISTGTPEGVGLGFKPPMFLKPGDVINCTIEKIGSLTNRLV